MKIEHNKNLQIETIAGDFQTQKAGIDESSMPFLFDLMSKSLYSNPIGSIVREITSNCFDSHIEANVDDAVIIRMGHDDEGDYISFNDFGVGLSPERIRKVYMNYFSSTKRDTDELIGGFGLGSKTPLSYTDMFYIITNFDGKKYEYLFHKGEHSPELDLLSEEDTTERNGTEIKIHIKTTSDKIKFINELKSQLCYFDNVYFEGCGIDNEYKIYEADTFRWRNKNEYSDNMHICYGKVSYPIDWEELNIKPVRVPVGIKFTIGEFQVTPSREAVRYTEETKKLIKERIEKVKDELDRRFSEQKLEFDKVEDYLEFKKSRACIYFSNEDRLYLTDFKLKASPVFTPFKDINYELKEDLTNALYDHRGYLTKDKFIEKSNIYPTLKTIKDYHPALCNNLTNITKIKCWLFSNKHIITERKLTFRALAVKLGIVDPYENVIPVGTAKIIYTVTKFWKNYILQNGLLNLDTYVPSIVEQTQYKEYLKENNAALQRKLAGKVSYKDVVRNYRNEWRVKDIENFKGIIVYGYLEDAKALSKAETFFNWLKRFSDDKRRILDRVDRKTKKRWEAVKIIQIAKNNQEYFNKTNMVHVKELYSDNRIFRKIATAIRITEFFKASIQYQTVTLNNYISLFEDINKTIAEDLKIADKYVSDTTYRDLLTDSDYRIFRKELLDIATKDNLFDPTIIHIIERLENYFKGAELLLYSEINQESIPYLLRYLKDKGKKICPQYYAEIIHKDKVKKGQLTIDFESAEKENELKVFKLKQAS